MTKILYLSFSYSFNSISSDWSCWSRWEPLLVGSSESLTIRLEVGVLSKDSCPSIFCEANVCVVQEIGVKTSNPEISTCKLVSNQELSFCADWVNSCQESWEQLIKDLWIHGLSLIFWFKEWRVDFANDIEVSVTKFIAFECLKWVLWIISVFASKHSNDSVTLTKSRTILKLKCWNLTVWHASFMIWPVFHCNSMILERNIRMSKKHSYWLTSNHESKVVECVFFLALHFFFNY